MLRGDTLVNRPAQKKQQGATLVETAMVLSLALMLVFGIIEFSLALFLWTRGVEATRAGVRYAVVNTPPSAVVLPDCGLNSSASTTTVCNASCDSLVAPMKSLLPELEASNVSLEYACSRAGNPENPQDIYEIRVSINGLSYNFVVPGILGVDASIEMPGFTSTHTAEDLYTVSP